MLQNYGDGIGLLTGVFPGYIFNLDWIGDCWKLTIRGALTELQWNAVRNSLRLVSPDGEQLYGEFYKGFYEDTSIWPSYGEWINIGGTSSKVEVSDYVYLYFK